MEFVRYHCMRTSVELAGVRGAFPAITGSLYDPADLRWEPPQPPVDYVHDYGRPEIDWPGLEEALRRDGIRNAAQTTIAPTGTIATVAGCESYGCEPVFALAYIRHVDDRGADLKLAYTSPLFEQALIEAGIEEAARQAIVERVMEHGSCQTLEEVPPEIREVFVVSQDIRAEEHVRIQAALQAFVDNSLSKTCNFPEDATSDDVARSYMLAWELGCKGLTVYVTGSRERIVLETHATASRRQGAGLEPAQLPIWQEGKKPRPQRLDGSTYQISTPLGKAFVTINQNREGQPFEVFITTAKAGSETAAVSEAIGRLVSYVLRVASPVSPRERMAELVRQMAGIGGARPMGFGPNRVLSLPDGVARALAEYLGHTPESAPADLAGPPQAQLPMQVGDLCPECGEGGLVNEEGCRKCYSCGFSEC
jgi:ribonucleoside-diphosphate reductase alpha chain